MYLSRVLNAAGLPACHECSGTGPPSWPYEVSWLGAAYLSEFDGHVVHLVRNPLDVIASLASNDVMDPARPFIRWLHTQLPDLAAMDPIAAACHYWTRWNIMVEPHAHERWQVENVHTEQIEALGRRLHLSRPLQAVRALRQVPTSLNSRGNTQPVTWEQLTPAVLVLAQHYGYEVTS
jgi:hypothetical protein